MIYPSDRCVIAIDPGANGGIATLFHGKVEAKNLSPDVDGMGVLVGTINTLSFMDECRIVMEDVGFHRQGNSAQASAKFGRNVGRVEGAIMATLGEEPERVQPKAWQKALGPLPKDKMERKRAIRDMMQAEFPHLKVTLATGDALGILCWAMGGKK